MKINKISKKLIKPCTPTPQNLKNYHISFLDQCVGTMSAVVILFYESKPDNDNQLEESLSKILVQFYPLAGRYIKIDQMVDCSDQGAEFLRAEAPDFELLDLVGKTEVEIEHLECLVPEQYFRLDEAADDPLLSIQITHFRCGGAAIAVNANHKIFDGASLGTFVTAWSSATNIFDGNVRVSVSVSVTPSFDLPSLLPKKHRDIRTTSSTPFGTGDATISVKRLLFNEEALTSLKSRIRPSNGRTASGVRVVCAVIADALLRMDRDTRGKNRDFVVLQPVNIRGRTIPPQPRHACGNFSVISRSRRVAASEGEDIGVEGLVDLIGDSVRETIADHVEILSPDRDGRDIIVKNLFNIGKEMLTPETNFITLNDWSRFGFYEADFGWGKPLWTSPGPRRHPITTTILMSNKEGDGIEAMVYLNQKNLSFFRQDEEIKLFMA